jgi:hypothetical protein
MEWNAMRFRWSWSIWVGGKPGSWMVGIVFSAVGALIAFWMPSFIQPSPDRPTALLIVHILSGIFLGLGLIILAYMGIDLYLGWRRPEAREIWYYWASAVGPLLAASLFAVPASLAFPALLVVYLLRPNAIFPAGSSQATGNLLIGLLFSALGAGSLLLIYVLARNLYRNRPGRAGGKGAHYQHHSPRP